MGSVVKALPRKQVLTDIVQLRYPLDSTVKLSNNTPERKFPLEGNFKLSQEYIPIDWSQRLPGKAYATPAGIRLVSTSSSVSLVSKQSFAVTDKSYLNIELKVKGYGKLQVGYFGYRKMKWSRAEYKNVKLSGDKQLVKIKLKIISRRGVPIDRIKFVLQADPNSDFVVESYNAKSNPH